MDMGAHVAPKSDQLNADDLIAGPRVIKITKVSGTGNADQPVAVYFEGDNSKPYKPCKGMRRVMIALWGADAAQYVGRRLTIYRDEKVVFGGMAVGGIRISHASNIDREMTMALTVTKAKRSPYTVAPLAAEKAAGPTARDRLYAAAREAAGKGERSFNLFFASLEQRAADALKPIMAELNATASQVPAHDADGVLTGDEPDPADTERGHPTDDEEHI